MRRARLGILLLALVSAGSVPGCGEGADETGPALTETEAVCPPEDPDCDRIDEPCVPDEGDGETAAGSQPGSSPMGLGGPLTSTGKHRIWPKGRVPYKIASTLDATTKSRLLSAMNEWQTKSQQRVRFEKALASDTAYVLVSTGSPRVEFVGYRAGLVSKLYLRDSEYITVTRHELGHVLGLEHEHRRKDRANYIQVLSSNIVNTTNCKYQFALCSDCALLGKYNVKSVMHYRSTRDLTSCRVNGKAVLLAKDGSSINHEWVLTTGDLAAIAELYGAPPTTGTGGTGGSDAGDSGKDAAGGADAATESGAGTGGSAGASGSAGAAGASGAAGNDGVEGDNGWSDSGIEGASGGTGATGGSGQVTTRLPDEESGCGCRAAPARSRHGLFALVAGALLLSRRRFRAG